MVKLVLADKRHVDDLYPEGLKQTFYGIAAESATGDTIGVSGLYFNQSWVMFARISEHMREHNKVTIWKAAKELMKAVKHLNQPVYAIADPSIPNSDKLLLRMGFKQVSKDWYVWQ